MYNDNDCRWMSAWLHNIIWHPFLSRFVEWFQYQRVRVGRESQARLWYRQLSSGLYFIPLQYTGEQYKPEPGNQLLSNARPFAGAERQKIFRFPDAWLCAGPAVYETIGVEHFRIIPVHWAGVDFVVVDDNTCAFWYLKPYMNTKQNTNMLYFKKLHPLKLLRTKNI